MSETTKFTIGGEDYEIPILHLAAQRVLLGQLPAAMESFTGKYEAQVDPMTGEPILDPATGQQAFKTIKAPDVDPLVRCFLETFACNAEDSHPILTVRYVERTLRGEEQSKGFMTSMWALIEASGFKVGEMLATLTAGLSGSPMSTSESSSTTSS